MKKKILSAALAASMALSMTPAAAFAAPGAEGHWAEGVLDEWMGYGVIKGYDDGSGVGPDNKVTRAEFVTMLDRVMGYKAKAENVYSDVAVDWYTDYILKGVAAGVIEGDDNGSTMRPNDPVSRQEACVILARVLGLDVASAPDAGFDDQAGIAEWAQGSVNAMKAEGYVAGNDGCFRPTDSTTRAEAVKMLDNIFAGLYQESGEYSGDVDGSAVVSADGVDLKGQTIEGDLVIAEGVGDGHVELDGVTVEGRVIVRGGGVNSVIIKGASKIGEIVVDRQTDPVRVAVEGDAEVGTVTVAEDTVSLILEGKVASVSVETPGAELSVAGEVETLTVAKEAEGAKVSVEKGAVVSSVVSSAPKAELSVAGKVESVSVKGDSTMVEAVSGGEVAKVEADASGTVVKGEGKVESVVAGESSSDVVVSTEGTEVVNNGSEAVTDGEGGTVAKPGEEATTPGGSTSGGGSTGGGSVTPAPNPSKVTVSNADELAEALADKGVSEITVSKNIGSPSEFNCFNVTRSVEIKGESDSAVYGSFIVTADGVSFDGLNIVCRGDAESGENTSYRNGISAQCKNLSVTNCSISSSLSSAGIANGLSIWPTDADPVLSISGNTFTGFDTKLDGYKSAAILISGGVSKPTVTGNDKVSVPATEMTSDEDRGIITTNTFVECITDYTRDNWVGSSNQVFARAISQGEGFGFGLAADGNTAYYVNGNITLTPDTSTLSKGSIVVLKNKKLSVVNSESGIAELKIVKDAKLVVEDGGSLDVYNGKLSGEGSVVVKSGGAMKMNANYDGGTDSKLPTIKSVVVESGGTLSSMTTAKVQGSQTGGGDPKDTVFVGSDGSARIKLGEGSKATFGFSTGYKAGEGVIGTGRTAPTLVIDGSATIPSGQTWYAMFDSGNDALGIDMTVQNGTLTVNGTLDVSSANKTHSNLVVGTNGYVVVSGLVDIAGKGKVVYSGNQVTGTGNGKVKLTSGGVFGNVEDAGTYVYSGSSWSRQQTEDETNTATENA